MVIRAWNQNPLPTFNHPLTRRLPCGRMRYQYSDGIYYWFCSITRSVGPAFRYISTLYHTYNAGEDTFQWSAALQNIVSERCVSQRMSYDGSWSGKDQSNNLLNRMHSTIDTATIVRNCFWRMSTVANIAPYRSAVNKKIPKYRWSRTAAVGGFANNSLLLYIEILLEQSPYTGMHSRRYTTSHRRFCCCISASLLIEYLMRFLTLVQLSLPLLPHGILSVAATSTIPSFDSLWSFSMCIIFECRRSSCRLYSISFCKIFKEFCSLQTPCSNAYNAANI